MNKKTAVAIVFGAALFFLLPLAKPQAAMVELSLDELVEKSDLIVVGTVESVRSELVQGKIFSFATILVRSNIKEEPGQGHDRIVVKFPGGTVGDVGMRVENSPDYKKGEEVVVFLKKVQDQSHFMTVGSSQGKFLVEDNVVVRENLPLEQFIGKVENIMGFDK